MNKDKKAILKKGPMAMIAGKSYEYIQIGDRLWMVDLLRYDPIANNSVIYGHVVWNNEIPDFIQSDTPSDQDDYYYMTNAGMILNNPEFKTELETACGDWHIPTGEDMAALFDSLGGGELDTIPFNVTKTGFYTIGGMAGTSIRDAEYQTIFTDDDFYYIYYDEYLKKYIIRKNDFNPKSGNFCIPIKLCKQV